MLNIHSVNEMVMNKRHISMQYIHHWDKCDFISQPSEKTLTFNCVTSRPPWVLSMVKIKIDLMAFLNVSNINGKNKIRWTRYSIFQWVYPIQILFSVTNDNLTVTVDFIIFWLSMTLHIKNLRMNKMTFKLQIHPPS